MGLILVRPMVCRNRARLGWFVVSGLFSVFSGF
jgi:hypothetical protein